ncbi:MAG: DUF5808 domain-containing protein, partial [Micropruina sp.]|nr:hypothetical protein [Micropruina sp.]
MIRSLDDLNPTARAAAQKYLDAVAADLDAEFREPVLCDLRAHLNDHLAADATEADVQALIDEAGPVVTGQAETSASETFKHRLTNGFRLTDADARVASTWWNPTDDRLFLPRALGWGWDLNFGALAVRLGLIEPDAESVPFSSTPDSAFKLAAAVPVALAGATVLHYAVRGRSLPSSLPANWDVAGAPNRWTSKRQAMATDLATTVLPAAVATWAAYSGRPRPNRAGAIAASTAVASVGAFVTLWRSLGGGRHPWAGPSMLGVLTGSIGGLLLGLAKAGRAAEIERDVHHT